MCNLTFFQLSTFLEKMVYAPCGIGRQLVALIVYPFMVIAYSLSVPPNSADVFNFINRNYGPITDPHVLRKD